MLNRVLPVAVFAVLVGFASVSVEAGKPTPTPAPCRATTLPTGVTQAQADTVMVDFCGGMATADIATMMAPMTEQTVKDTICMNWSSTGKPKPTYCPA